MGDEPTTALDRRNLIRGGAVLAGAVGATAIGAAIAPTKAAAVDGAPIVQGAENLGLLRTTIGIQPEAGRPTLRLINSGGPALKLEPITNTSWQSLQAGELAASNDQLYVGFGSGADAVGLPVATLADLDVLPLLQPVNPDRILNTLTVAGRANVVAQSPSPFDSQGRLIAGRSIDIRVADVGNGTDVSAVFLNLTVTKPAGSGFLAVVPGGFAYSGTSSINFVANQSIANGCFVGTRVVAGSYAITVYAQQTTAVLIDLTGAITGAEVTTTGARTTTEARTVKSAKARKLLARRARQ